MFTQFGQNLIMINKETLNILKIIFSNTIFSKGEIT